MEGSLGTPPLDPTRPVPCPASSPRSARSSGPRTLVKTPAGHTDAVASSSSWADALGREGHLPNLRSAEPVYR